ncbi:MAG: alpha/beta hydrolase [Gemmatimonadales bacterium]|nr:alpha/beta hydrolase [Gemmatimonadales bacterium]
MNARINGIDLVFDQEGNGHPVLLIHGFPLNRHMWRPQVDALTTAGYRVVTPDLRGFGDSPIGKIGSGGLDLLADDLVALLDHLEIDQAVIGGMSMGGYILLNLLARHPDRIRAACLLVTRANADDETARAKRDHLIGEVEAGNPIAVADAFIQVLFAEGTATARPELVAETHRWLAATSPAGLLFGLRAIRDRVDSTRLLPGFNRQTLVIGAELDQTIPVERSRDLAAGIPDAELVLIPAAGHMANLERPEAFNQALLEFLSKVF